MNRNNNTIFKLVSPIYNITKFMGLLPYCYCNKTNKFTKSKSLLIWCNIVCIFVTIITIIILISKKNEYSTTVSVTDYTYVSIHSITMWSAIFWNLIHKNKVTTDFCLTTSQSKMIDCDH